MSSARATAASVHQTSSTPELDQVRAHLATLVPYRVAAGVLEHFLPVEAGITHETLRGCTLKLGEGTPPRPNRQ